MSVQTAPAAKARMSNLELLRIVSMFFVVLYHFANRVGASTTVATGLSVNRMFLLGAGLLGELGNALFVLISGYFLVNSAFSARRLLRLWAQTLFYSLLFAALFALGGRAISGRELLRVCLPVLSNDYWFITCYVIFSLFAPFVNRMLRALSRGEFVRLLATMLVIFSLLPTVFNRGGAFGFSKLADFLMFYCLGAYVRMYPDALRAFQRPRRCFAAAACVFALHIVYLALCCVFEGRSSLLEATRLSRMSFVPQVLLAFALFLGFARLRMPCVRWVNTAASAVFGVFLIHYNLFVRDWLTEHLIEFPGMRSAATMIPATLASVLPAYLACTLIDLARQRFVEPLYMRLVDRLPPVRRERERRKG